jgi:hypothetical protein
VGICFPRVARVAAVALCYSAAFAAAACSSSSNKGSPGEGSGDAGNDAGGNDGGGGLEAPEASTNDATVGTNDASGGHVDATLEGDAPSDGGLDATTTDAAPEGGSTADGVTGCATDSSGEPTELRCTGLYADWPSRTIASGVVEFDPGIHLWSDGAVKTRWVYLPPGVPIDTSNMDEWVFPAGTKFWKQFVVQGVLIETRLLHKMPAAPDAGPYAGAWYLTTYHWSTDQQSTQELTVGEMNVNDAGYEIPNQAKCQECHDGRKDIVLGFEAIALSSPDAGGLPMSALEAQNLLTNPPDASLAIPGDPTQAAALGYLHMNCGVTCHNGNPQAAASSTGFHMRLLASELGSVQATDTYTTGWGQAVVNGQLAQYGVTTRLEACDAPQSCVYFRMSHRDQWDDAGNDISSPRLQMPQIDTHQVDPTGMGIVAAWINEGCDASVPLDAGAPGLDAAGE